MAYLLLICGVFEQVLAFMCVVLDFNGRGYWAVLIICIFDGKVKCITCKVNKIKNI